MKAWGKLNVAIGSKGNDSGMTLIEVLVAIFILMLVLVPVTQLVMNELQTVASQKNSVEGTAFASSLLSELHTTVEEYYPVANASGQTINPPVCNATTISSPCGTFNLADVPPSSGSPTSPPMGEYYNYNQAGVGTSIGTFSNTGNPPSSPITTVPLAYVISPGGNTTYNYSVTYNMQWATSQAGCAAVSSGSAPVPAMLRVGVTVTWKAGGVTQQASDATLISPPLGSGGYFNPSGSQGYIVAYNPNQVGASNGATVTVSESGGGPTYTTYYDSNGCALFINVPAASSGSTYYVSSGAGSQSVTVCPGMTTDVEFNPNQVPYQPGSGCSP